MADTTRACAPAPLHVHITSNMQALYARCGMWINGSPQGVLAGMLGPLVPFLSNDERQTFYVSADQLAALWRDMLSVPAEAVGGCQHAQFLRRLREAARRAGTGIAEILAAQPGAHPTLGTLQAAAITTAAPVPFHPLLCPSHGKAMALFQDHVMRTVREFVDYTQSSEYMQGAQA